MWKSIGRGVILFTLALSLGGLIVGCKSKPGVDGKYVNTSLPGASITFSGGKAVLADPSGVNATCDYSVVDNTVTLKSPSGDVPFTINADGSLTSTILGTFKRS